MIAHKTPVRPMPTDTLFPVASAACWSGTLRGRKNKHRHTVWVLEKLLPSAKHWFSKAALDNSQERQTHALQGHKAYSVRSARPLLEHSIVQRLECHFGQSDTLLSAEQALPLPHQLTLFLLNLQSRIAHASSHNMTTKVPANPTIIVRQLGSLSEQQTQTVVKHESQAAPQNQTTSQQYFPMCHRS
jgi:hypothetical protein